MEESIMPLKKNAKLPLEGQTIDLGQLFEDIRLKPGDTLIVARDYTLYVERAGQRIKRAMLKDIAVRAKVVTEKEFDVLLRKEGDDGMEIEEDLEMEE